MKEKMKVEIPCRIGDTVYGIRNYQGTSYVKQGIVSDMFFNKDMDLIIVVYHICRGKWGERIFATEEEANAVLNAKERK